MRYERKFPSRFLAQSDLERLILQHPAGFRKTYPDRQVNNVYFDTPGWQTFQENLAGISERTKYRLRWYGRQTDPIEHSRFELKKKENLLGTKIIQAVPEKINWQEISHLPNYLPRLRFNALQPTLINTYQRAYYESSDGCFRLTIDQQLQCAAFHNHTLPLRHFPEHLRVVELKYAQEDDDRLDEFTQYWPLRLYRFSKYVMGMQLVYGGR